MFNRFSNWDACAGGEARAGDAEALPDPRAALRHVLHCYPPARGATIRYFSDCKTSMLTDEIPLGGCWSSRISFSLTHYTFLKKGDQPSGVDLIQIVAFSARETISLLVFGGPVIDSRTTPQKTVSKRAHM